MDQKQQQQQQPQPQQTIRRSFLGASIPGEYTEVLQYYHHEEEISSDFDNTLLLKPSDVLIEVSYSDINPVDLQKLRNFKLPPPHITSSNDDKNKPKYYFIPGYGGSGIVTKVGKEVVNNNNVGIMQGKRVCFICDPSRQQRYNGSYSTHVVVDSRNVAILPDNISSRDAASIPVAGLTAYESLLKLGIIELSKTNNNNKTKQQQELETTTTTKTKKRKSLLIVGGAGGVGSWAIILARYTSKDLNIIVTWTTPQQQEWCLSLGANETIQHGDIDTTPKLPGSKDGCVDYILCLTEPTHEVFAKLSNIIKVYGQICFVVAGESINSIDLSFCFFKCVSIHCQTVFSSIRTNYQNIIPSEELNIILELMSSSANENKVNAPISPDILTAKKISIQFQDALKPNCGVLHALLANNCGDGSDAGRRRGKFVLQIQQQQEEEGADNK